MHETKVSSAIPNSGVPIMWLSTSGNCSVPSYPNYSTPTPQFRGVTATELMPDRQDPSNELPHDNCEALPVTDDGVHG